MIRTLLRRRAAAGDERGAVAVWVALLVVPLIVVAALAVDIGAAHADRQRLQTGADAAALAVARECAAGRACTTDANNATAQALATANAPFGGAALATASRSGNYVEVHTSSTRDHWFGGIAGIEDIDLAASAAASWGAPNSSTGHLPLTFSWCEIAYQVRTATGLTDAQIVTRDAAGNVTGITVPASVGPVTMYNTGGPNHSCNPASNAANQVPGGFGWINTTTSCLGTHTAVGTWIGSATGNNTGNCSQANFLSIKGQLALLPVYDATQSQGANAGYRIVGYVGFRLQAWYFAAQVSQNIPNTNQPPCNGSGRCIYGTIEQIVTLDPSTSTGNGGQSMGSQVISLRLPGGH